MTEFNIEVRSKSTGETKTITVDAKNIEEAQQKAVAIHKQGGPVGTGEDVLRSGAAGVGRGFIGLAGLPGDIRQILQSTARGAEWLANQGGMSFGPEPEEIKGIPHPPTTQELVEKATEYAPFLGYQPQTTAGQVTERMSEFAPDLVTGRLALRPFLQRGATTTAAAGGSELAGQGAELLGAPDWASELARVVGGAGGGGLGHARANPPSEHEILRRYHPGPQNLQQFDRLGDEALLLQASPTMEGFAQGTAVRPGVGKDIINNALDEQLQNRGRRLTETANRAGLPQGVTAQQAQDMTIANANQRAGPLYEQALQTPPNVPPPGAPTTIEDLVSQQMTTPGEQMSLSRRQKNVPIMNDIDDALAEIHTNPELAGRRLHDIRKDLDRQIVYDPRQLDTLSSADKANQDLLKNARGVVDDILKNRFGFTDADEIMAAANRRKEAVTTGQTALDAGKYAKHPAELRQELSRMTPAERRAAQIGMGHDIRTALGTQGNELSALRNKVGGDIGFNREKIRDVFSQPTVDELVQGVERERAFSRSHGKIVEGSQTAQRSAAAKSLEEDPLEISSQATLPGLLLKGAVSPVNWALRRGRGIKSESDRARLARILTTRGPEARALLQRIQNAPPRIRGQMRAAVINALLGSTELRAGSDSEH